MDLSRRAYLAAGVAGAGAYLYGPGRARSGFVLTDERARDQRLRPVMGGTWLSPRHSDQYGTLGIGVEYDSGPAVVTNRHVVDQSTDDSPEDVIGTIVDQPGDDDSRVGEVVDASTIGGAGSSDWAVVGLDESSEWSTRTLGFGSVGAAVSASAGDRVVLDGAATGLLGGWVARVGVSANFRGELYSGLIEYQVDEDRPTDGDSGAVVAVIDSDGEVRPVGLHTFTVDQYRFAIPWSDLPSVDPAVSANSPSAPAVGAQVEGAIVSGDSTGVEVWVRNLGDVEARPDVDLLDPDGGRVDRASVRVESLSETIVSLDPGGRESVVLSVGEAEVETVL